MTASNYGGPNHSQWYYNLNAHPECELGGEKFLASEVTDPDDYARVYGLAEQVYAGWRDYRLNTDPIGRHIPVFGSSHVSPKVPRLACSEHILQSAPGGPVGVTASPPTRNA